MPALTLQLFERTLSSLKHTESNSLSYPDIKKIAIDFLKENLNDTSSADDLLDIYNALQAALTPIDTIAENFLAILTREEQSFRGMHGKTSTYTTISDILITKIIQLKVSEILDNNAIKVEEKFISLLDKTHTRFYSLWCSQAPGEKALDNILKDKGPTFSALVRDKFKLKAKHNQPITAWEIIVNNHSLLQSSYSTGKKTQQQTDVELQPFTSK